MISSWELDSAAVIDELLLLATERRLLDRMRVRPSKLTESDPLLSRARTPAIWHIYRGMLFVGISHNLLVESFVSRMKRLERAHPNTHALTLGHLFKYKVAQERARKERIKIRSLCRGGLRECSLAADAASSCARAFGSANDNKAKLRELVKQVERDVAR